MGGQKESVTVGIGTIPGREEQLEKTLQSLLDQDGVQADAIYVHHKTKPDWSKWPKGSAVHSVRVGHTWHGLSGMEDPGDQSKFIWAEQTDSYYAACDDDIIYPPDYLQVMTETVAAHGDKVMACVHGINITDDTFRQGYYRSRRVFNTAHALAADRRVHEPGAGTLVYHAGMLDLSLEHFRKHGMADCWAAVWAKEWGVDIWCVARPKGWLVVQDVPDTIFDAFERAKQAGDNPDWFQTQLMREASPWPALP